MEKIVKDSLVPKQAIIVYKSDKSCYLETRKILKSGKFGAGVPMKKETLSKIMNEIKTNTIEKTSISGFIPENLMLFRENVYNLELIWYVKSANRNLSFIKKLGIDDGIMELPTLVFYLKNGNINVYAVKSKKPSIETKLYRAPLHNINSIGEVCMGNSKIKKFKGVSRIMKAYEDGFFMSKFSEIHNGSPIKVNLNTFLQKQIKEKLKFDNNVLIPSKVGKIKDLI